MKKIVTLAVSLAAFFVIPVLLVHPGCATAKSISKDKVNIRSGPSLKSSVVFRVPVGYPIKIEKEQGDWVFFRDWEDDTGWVYKPLISDIDTAVIVVNQANVRSGAGKKFGVTLKAKKGEIYKIIEKKGEWIHLGYYYSGEPVGWVRSDLLFGD